MQIFKLRDMNPDGMNKKLRKQKAREDIQDRRWKRVLDKEERGQ
jgi:hypothetical protein